MSGKDIPMSSTGIPMKDCRFEAGPNYCPIKESPFNYRPAVGANAFFTAFFALSIVVAAFTMKKYKTWNYSTMLIIGCILEILGYIGRVMAYSNPFNRDAFLMQIICLTIAPVFFAAAIYFTLSRIVHVYGREYSRIPPVAYTWIFLSADILSLILQAAGGAIASTSTDEDAGSDSRKGLQTGNNIMIAGLLTQVVTLLIFIAICTDYFLSIRRSRRAGLSKPSNAPWQGKVLLFSLGLATLCVLIRSVFRVAELWEGWNGELMSHEGVFIGLEGVLLVVAVGLLAGLNPGWGFRDGHVWRFGDVSMKKLRSKHAGTGSSSSSA